MNKIFIASSMDDVLNPTFVISEKEKLLLEKLSKEKTRRRYKPIPGFSNIKLELDV